MGTKAETLGQEVMRVLRRARRCTDGTREEKRERGVKYCRYAGYGWRWSAKTGRRVKDKRERRVMGAMLAWRAEGWSWRQIARHLEALGVRTRDRKKWSVARVYRACWAEEELRKAEGAFGSEGS